MSFRGYPAVLTEMLTRAGNTYCSPGTLRFFNAYCGEVLYRDENRIVIVESTKSPWDDRRYNVMQFTFSPDGSSVTVDALTDGYTSAARAKAAYRYCA